jgi:hypothetical protein
MMTLDEFIARGPKPFPRNAYVCECGFEFMYVRWGGHLINNKVVWFLDLANIRALEEGKGTFKRLIARLRSEYPTLPLYVESVLNTRLIPGLLRMGFKPISNSSPPSFAYLP